MNKRFLPYFVLATILLASSAWSQVVVTAPWARATVPGQDSTAAYMQLKSARNATLLSAESPAAKKTEIHEMKMEGTVMRMSAIPKLDLPAGKSVELKPGGYHVMLTGLKQPLKKGDVVQIQLRFEEGDKSVKTVEVRAEVQDAPPAASTAKGGSMQDMKMQ